MIAPVRPAYVVIRLLLAVVFVSIAAVLIVEGVLIRQLGQGRPLMGHLTEIDPGQPGGDTGEIAFTYVTFDGRDRRGACRVPAEVARRLASGQRLEIYERVGLRRTYACIEEGIPRLMPDSSKSLFWGLASGVVSLLMIAALLYDLWAHARDRARASATR